jgi:hypothetical protein
MSGLIAQLTRIRNSSSFLSSEFLLSLLVISILAWHQQPWLVAAVAWAYMLARLWTKRSYGLNSSGIKTTEFAMALIVPVLAPAGLVYLQLAISASLFSLCRASAKARPESNTVVLR